MVRSVFPVVVFLALVLLWGCTSDVRPPSSDGPPRIVSLSPALTEMLFQMGLGEQVVGVSRYSRLPEGEDRPVVGDALTVSLEAVLALDPDFVLIQSDPGVLEPLKAVRPSVGVEHFQVETMEEIGAAMERLGHLAGAPEKGASAASDFRAGLDALAREVDGAHPPSVLFLLGWERPATAGRGTFIHELIVAAGGRNAAKELQGWKNVDLEHVLTMAPDVLVCWTDERHQDEATSRWSSLDDLPAARAGRVHVVSDPRWTMPTGGLLNYLRQLSRMLHPEPARTEAGS